MSENKYEKARKAYEEARAQAREAYEKAEAQAREARVRTPQA